MLKLGGIDFELSTLNKNAQFGSIVEYIEKKMISGKIRRIEKGKRFSAEFSYAYLTDEQRNVLMHLKNNQPIYAEISTPDGIFKGEVYLDINDLITRFAFINNKWVWSNYSITLTGVDYIE